ncbi:glycosyl hydrolase [Citrobacter koseri]|uniref:Glycosyl hydrolase n=1 Tax=Citrobacter koseri TaxID=545 RepID=A0A2X2WUF0_CITKO|nr:glycosyl hydrolase [Citrobacter koseri]
MHTLHNITLTTTDDGFTLSWQDRLLLSHSAENPCLWIGAGVADIDMFRGNFSIKDKLNEKIALTDATISQSPDGWLIHFNRGDAISAALHIATDEAGRLTLKLQNSDLTHNRIWLRLAAQPEDHIYGCGEQFSYFDLRGKPFPLWTSEQGVGATKTAMSPGRRTAKKTRAGITTGPFSHSPLLSARKSTTATSITAAT